MKPNERAAALRFIRVADEMNKLHAVALANHGRSPAAYKARGDAMRQLDALKWDYAIARQDLNAYIRQT